MIPAESVNTGTHTYPKRRVLIAFLSAPLAGPLGIYIGMAVLHGEIGHPGALLVVLPFFYLFAAPVVYAFSFLLGVPFYLLLHSLLGLTRNRLIAGWMLIGPLSLILLSRTFIPKTAQELTTLFPFVLGGAAVGYTFWRVLSLAPRAPRRISAPLKTEESGPDNPGRDNTDWR